jgi:site-specific DNA recombinase
MATEAIYARVSSARQKEEQTIGGQVAASRAHAAANALEIPPDWVFEDDGYSGATLVRPALERLRDLAAEIEIPVVLCYAPYRLARRYVYQILLIEEFARVGTELRFVKGRKVETPEDELLLQFASGRRRSGMPGFEQQPVDCIKENVGLGTPAEPTAACDRSR